MRRENSRTRCSASARRRLCSAACSFRRSGKRHFPIRSAESSTVALSSCNRMTNRTSNRCRRTAPAAYCSRPFRSALAPPSLPGIISNFYIPDGPRAVATGGEASHLARVVAARRPRLQRNGASRDRPPAQLQEGKEPSDWKPLPTVGTGVIEIRAHGDGEHRVIVVARFAEAVYVLHAFMKTSRKTSLRDLDLARRRWRDLLMERARDE